MSRYLFPSGLRCQWQLRKILHTPQVFSELHPPLSHLLWWASVGLQINEMKINLHPCFAQMKQEMSIPSIFTECCSSFVIFLAQVGHSCSDEWFVMQCEFDSPHTCMIYIKLAGSPWVCHTHTLFLGLVSSSLLCVPVSFSLGCAIKIKRNPQCHSVHALTYTTVIVILHLVAERFGICYCMNWRVAYIFIHWLLTQFDPGFTALIRSKVLILLFLFNLF